MIPRHFCHTGCERAARLAVCIIAAGTATLVAAALASCRRPPTAPSAAFVTGLELIAPATLAPGATAQFRLIAHRSDRTSENVTHAATFSSQSPEILAISRDGVATALQVGDSLVTGRTGFREARSEVVVVPDGTFRVVGQVVEQRSPTLPVGGVLVQAESGASDLTDLDGRYRLYGVPAQLRLLFSKNGYATKELSLLISDHHSQAVALELDGPRADFAGTYQLTVDAASACRTQLPEAVHTRQYAATISQSGTDLRIRLSGANFVSAALAARIEQSAIVLDFINYPYQYGHCENPYVQFVEKIDEATYFMIHGLARLASIDGGFAGALRGTSVVSSCVPCSYPCSDEAEATCGSHQVTLSR